MAHHLQHDEDVMPADRDHAWRRCGGLELEPVGGEPQLANRLAEDLHSRGAAAERAARTAFGMSNDRDFPAAQFDVVVPNSLGLLLCSMSALGAGTVALLIALWPELDRSPACRKR